MFKETNPIKRLEYIDDRVGWLGDVIQQLSMDVYKESERNVPYNVRRIKGRMCKILERPNS